MPPMLFLSALGMWHLYEVLRDKMLRPGVHPSQHLWGNPFIPGYLLGSIGAIIPVGLALMAITKVIKWIYRGQVDGVGITMFIIMLAFVITGVGLYIRDIKMVWHAPEQRDGFFQGTLLAVGVISLFFVLFASFLNRMPKPWTDRAYNKHPRASTQRLSREEYRPSESMI